MNYDNERKVINGDDTYQEIADHLLESRAVVIGWSDNDSTCYDIAFTIGPTHRTGNLLNRFNMVTSWFDMMVVSIMGVGAFAFDSGLGDIHPDYIGEKLNVPGSVSKQALADLINGVIQKYRAG